MSTIEVSPNLLKMLIFLRTTLLFAVHIFVQLNSLFIFLLPITLIFSELQWLHGRDGNRTEPEPNELEQLSHFSKNRTELELGCRKNNSNRTHAVL